MKRLVIDKQIVKNNLAVVRKKLDGAELYAALKYDAYGLGLREMASVLRDAGVTRFAVMEPQDARTLREAGFADEEILMLRSTSDSGELGELLDLSVVFTIGSDDAAVALNGIAEKRGVVAEAHIKLDTGAGGYGLLSSERDQIVSIFRYMSSIKITGIYTDLMHSDRKSADRQMLLFDETIKYISDAGFETGMIHACRSRALMKFGPRDIDGFCVGSALFRAIDPRSAPQLRNAAWAEVETDEVRWVPKGHYIGGKHKTRRPMRIAVLPIGRYHGCFSEEDARKGLFKAKYQVRINSNRLNVVGDPAMQFTVVDVTRADCGAGTKVQLPVDPIFASALPRLYL